MVQIYLAANYPKSLVILYSYVRRCKTKTSATRRRKKFPSVCGTFDLGNRFLSPVEFEQRVAHSANGVL